MSKGKNGDWDDFLNEALQQNQVAAAVAEPVGPPAPPIDPVCVIFHMYTTI